MTHQFRLRVSASRSALFNPPFRWLHAHHAAALAPNQWPSPRPVHRPDDRVAAHRCAFANPLPLPRHRLRSRVGRRAARIRAVAHRRVRLGPLWKRWAGRRVSGGQRRALAPGRRGIWQAIQADASRANGRDPRWPGAGAFRRGDWRDHDHAGARGAGRFFLSRASLRRRRRLAQGVGAGFRARRLRRWSRSNSVR